MCALLLLLRKLFRRCSPHAFLTICLLVSRNRRIFVFESPEL